MPNTLTPSDLKTLDDDEYFKDDMNDNWTRLNNTLLKLSNLLDVDDTGLSHGDILKYNSASTKWEPQNPSIGYSTTTTTTTTTSTTV